MPKKKEAKAKPAVSKPKPADLGTGAASKAASLIMGRSARSQAAMDEASKILMGAQRSDEHQ